MAVIGELLFYRRDMVGLSDLLRLHVEGLRAAVDALPDKQFAAMSDADVASKIAGDQAKAPLVVDFSGATAAVVETQIEVNDRFSGPIRVPGLLATKTLAFTGDPDLWTLHAGSWSTNPPRAEVRRGSLVIGMSVPTQQADQAVRYIEDTLAQLPETLAQQKAMLDEHNAALRAKALPWILARRQRQGAASDLLKKLGG